MKTLTLLLSLTLLFVTGGLTGARAADFAAIKSDAHTALHELYAQNPKAAEIGHRAVAVLVFPHVVKAGFMVGAQRGDGALLRHGQTIGYYRTRTVSYGLQAGVQEFAYVLFFMNEHALAALHKDGGFELGVGPSVVVVDAGMAKTMSTRTLGKDVYAFIYDQKGLMAGLGLAGSRIKPIDP